MANEIPKHRPLNVNIIDLISEEVESDSEELYEANYINSCSMVAIFCSENLSCNELYSDSALPKNSNFKPFHFNYNSCSVCS